MKKIYLDHSSTTPISGDVLKSIKPYLGRAYGNASSIHFFGRDARETIDESREMIAGFLNSLPEEIIFTSGGTESDNLAIKGVINGHCEERDPSLRSGQAPQSQRLLRSARSDDLPHIITSKIEHHAVLHTIEKLEKEGGITATYLPVDRGGVVEPEKVKKAIKKNTLLVSIIYANNEVGTIQPIREIGKIIEKINKNRESKIYFHTDAVQAAGYLNCDTKYLHVDLLTLTAHKIYGPKGIGILFVKKGTPLKPEIIGGEQEWGKRAGTENVAGIVGIAEAISRIKNKELRIKNIEKLRNKLETGLKKKIPNTIINGDKKNRLPNISSISFPGAEAESILMMLDQKGIAASSGSACTSLALEPSHVLGAMGIDHATTNTTIRFSLGKDNTRKEIDYVIKVLPEIIERLRKISGGYKISKS